jgi:microcystin degradation protein MlrC
MHGAVHVTGLEDAEGDLIAAIRAAVGPDCRIAASYDLHGNLSARVMCNLDLLSAYRTAPHVDWYETLERVNALLVDAVTRRVRPAKAFMPVPILLPGEQTSTEWEPAASLYAALPEAIERYGLADASILIGYVWADEARASASVAAFGPDAARTQAAAAELAERFWSLRRRFTFGAPAHAVDECIALAMGSDAGPVIISDSGDNPTAGGAGDLPHVLERLLALRARGALVASIADAAAVARCHGAGAGASLELELGGKLDPVHGRPLPLRGKLRSLHRIPWSVGTSGERSQRAAVLEVDGVQVIVTERRTPFHTRRDFERLGLDPQAFRLIVVKIGYLVPELKQLAARELLALSPGAVDQNITQLVFRRQRRPLFPFDPNMEWRAPSSNHV